jgi:ATP-dependent Clp protease ATP-binding subunit ClpA
MFERYTEQAKQAIESAKAEAMHRGAQAVSTSHLLLGLASDDASRVAQIAKLKDRANDICAGLGISPRPAAPSQVVGQSNVPYSPGGAPYQSSVPYNQGGVPVYQNFAPLSQGSIPMSPGSIPFSADAQVALAHAEKEANRDWSQHIDTDHLLRGLMRFKNDASDSLKSAGIHLPDVRAAAKQHRIQIPSAKSSFGWLFKQMWKLAWPVVWRLGLAVIIAVAVVIALHYIKL